MRTARHVLLLALAFLLQTTWLQAIEITALRPDLVLLTLLLIALRAGPTEGALLGLGIGFLQDTQMPEDLGLNTLIKAVMGYFAGRCGTGIATDTLLVQVTLIFLAVLIHDLAFCVGSSGIPMADVPFFWLRHSVGGAVYTTLVGVIVYAGVMLRNRLFAA
jgi:rod shape-determining protein MreD